MSLAQFTGALAGAVARRPWLALAAWGVVLGCAGPWAAAWPERAGRGSDELAGSESTAVAAVLRTGYRNPFLEPIVVVDAPAGAEAALRQCPAVAEVRVRAPGVLLVAPRGEARAAVAAVRAAVGAPALTTGAAAIGLDMAAAIAHDSARAEHTVLPLAGFLLLFAFGSPVAAALPLLLALTATLLALAAASLLATVTPLGPYVTTVVPMLGLALGIDGGLLITERFREERRAGATPEAAARTAGATAGRTIAVSAAVVAAALAGLPFLGSADAIAIGTGGVLAVVAVATAALGLLPALLVLAAPWLDWPRRGVAPRRASQDRLVRWGAFVTRHKVPALAAGAALLAALALPAIGFRSGIPGIDQLPPGLESVRGIKRLGADGGVATPMPMLVRAKDGTSPLAPRGLDFLFKLSQRLHQDPRVAEVKGPVDLKDHAPAFLYRWLWAHADRYPEARRLFVRADGQEVLVLVRTRQGLPLRDAQALVHDLRTPDATWEVRVGGPAAEQLDYQTRLATRGPWVVAASLAACAPILALAFRSLLVPLKALALNGLVTLAALGLTVAVFQPTLGALPPIVPLLVFCLTFGLSMDYELFLLARVREAWLADPTEAAIARGLGEAGHVIAWAAVLMGLVFCAFAAGDTIFVRLLGFGLAAAIAIDATLVRGVLAPALLAIAGRWNWWPGDR